jgi:fibro-slime domain-containing protein
MKLKKLMTVLLLCFLMLGASPVGAFAEADLSGGDAAAAETTVGDILLKVQGVPENVTLGAETVAPDSFHKDLVDVVGTGKVVFAIDITLTDEDGEAWQPAEGEIVTVSLDGIPDLTDGDSVGILHDRDGDLKDLGNYIVGDGGNAGESSDKESPQANISQLTFTTDGFSVFYGYTEKDKEPEKPADGTKEPEKPEDGTKEPEKPEDGTDDSDGLGTKWVQYTQKTDNGISVIINAPEGSFPKGTKASLSVDNAKVADSAVRKVIKDDIIGIVPLDISFGGAQPSNEVLVSLDIPAKLVPSGGNMLKIVHMSSNGPEVVGIKQLDTSDAGEKIVFATDSFSSYAAVFVDGKYNSQLMRDVLAGNTRYSIVEFPVDLFDYVPDQLNAALDAVTPGGLNNFYLPGYNNTAYPPNDGINNSTAEFAKQGVVQNALVGGLPVINYLSGTGGQTTGQILFSDSYAASGKTIYDNLPFEFIYDNTTGYYEYKSSANHAQLNTTTNKVELYADTLSTQNSSPVATLDLSKYSPTGVSDFDPTTVTASAGSFKGTAKDMQPNGRLDPSVVFPTVGTTAAPLQIHTKQVGRIVVKAKIPAGVGANQFQLFFSSDKYPGTVEAQSFGFSEHAEPITYTANGDWIEFVIDTSENALWAGTASEDPILTSIRVDLFDSTPTQAFEPGYGGVPVGDSYPVEISEIKFITKGVAGYTTYGGFYPFSEIEDSYPGNNTAFTYDAWQAEFLDNGDVLDTHTTASRSIFNPTPNPATLLYPELAFGSVLEFPFYIPVDKAGKDGTDLIYRFSGDDDLWVFVDDQLVLDIGGAHGAITGSVNFTTGAWNVENAVKVTGYDTGATATAAPQSGTIAAERNKTGMHKMKIFYLERGGSVSNCFMKFNLPLTPTGDVAVSKEAVEKNDADDTALLAAEFEFQISTQDKGVGGPYPVLPLANTDYEVFDSSTSTTSSGTTDGDGKFKLKSGQTAYFEIAENYEVTVTETQKIIPDHDWISTTVNGSAGFTLTQLTVKEEQKDFDFVNTYENLYGNLEITKTGISDLDHNSEETQSTIYVISGTTSKGDDFYMEIAIVGNSSKLINHIPIGTYTVTEKTDWSWRYGPESNSDDVEIVGGGTAETLFVNERTEIYWLSGDSHCENWWGGADGTVVKREADE